MKLAILETDILYDSLRPTYQGYGAMFENLLRGAGSTHWQISIYPVIDGHYPADINDYQAYLITGSKYDSFAEDTWIVQLRSYVQTLFEAGKPMVGICFGHQLLAHALGGRAGRCQAGWGLGVMQYQLDHQPEFIDAQDPVHLIVSHQDQVLSLPPKAKRLLSNGFCPNAAFYIPHRVLAIQGHPEFDVDYAKALLNMRAHQFTDEFLQGVHHSYLTPHHGERVSQWMRRFIEASADCGLQS